MRLLDFLQVYVTNMKVNNVSVLHFLHEGSKFGHSRIMIYISLWSMSELEVTLSNTDWQVSDCGSFHH